MDSIKLNNLIKLLMQQYQHILGEQHRETISSEKIIENIVNYYEDIISSIPGNVYWLDKNCIAVGCSKNVLDMFGFKSLEEFKGLSFEEMSSIGNWTPEATQSFKNDTLEVIKTGKLKLNTEEPPIPHRDGRIIHFLTSRVPLFDQENNVIGIVGISIDITELKNTQAALKKAKEQAEMASHAKSEFVANMSHDVKTPLAGIIGMAELLTHRLTGENLEFAQILLTSGRQLLSFFENCLEVFKLENGDIAFASEHFNLKSVLDEIYGLFQPAIKAKKLTFNLYYDNHIPNCLIGSRAGVYRVLLNLVGNAVKFTHKGSVTIYINLNEKSTAKKAIITLTVEDTGIGIAKEKQKVIFERFTRLIPSYKGIYGGSGIGLYIVKKFVESMQGEIYVKSEKDKGSQFTVCLPFQIPENTSQVIPLTYQAPNPAEQSHKTNLLNIRKKIELLEKPLKILLVEDNPTAQRMESSLLSSINCQVDIADCGEKALEIFEPGKYDLIFMDIGLPGIQGDAVSKLIRKIERGTTQPVPIIGLTAHTTEDLNKHCLMAGMQGIFGKPLLHQQAKQIIEHYYFPEK